MAKLYGVPVMDKRLIKAGVLYMGVHSVSASAAVLAQQIMSVPCLLISAIFDALSSIGPALVTIMFLYGGVKYVFSSDDPGGRKQGKTICIHAIIGFVIMAVLSAVVNAVVNALGTIPMCGISI